MSPSFIFTPQTGIQRDFSPYENPQGSFNRLINARLVPGRSRIEQTPQFYSTSSWSAGNYYNSGSVSESSTNPAALCFYKNGLLYNLSSETAHVGSTQMQVFRQTVTPAANTINTQCFVQVKNPAAFAITLGSTFDIVIDAATTFKWRKNGGAYTTGVAITTTGVSIDGGNAIVYFITAAGFSVSDTWTWTRTDRLADSQVQMQKTFYDWSYAIANTTFANFAVYFPDSTGRVMVLDSLSGCIMTAGYRPIYGTHVAIYYNHLFVLTYSTGAANDNTMAKLTNQYGNSDLGDLNNFFSTDTNEADTGTLQPATIPENYEGSTGGFGLSVINGILFAYMSSRIWSTSYDGLPTPFSFQEFRTIEIGPDFARPVKTLTGDYFMTSSGIQVFDGNNITPVSNNVCEVVDRATTQTNIVWGAYDADRREVYFFCNSENCDAGTAGFWVFQEITNSWYFRAASFVNYPNSMLVLNKNIYLPVGLGFIGEDKTGGQDTLLKDFNHAASFQLPLIELSDQSFGNIAQVKDLQDSYLDCYYRTATGLAYGTTGVVIDYSVRNYDRGTITYPSSQSATWVSSATDGTLSLRGSGRLWRFRIQPIVTTNKVPFGFEFNTLLLDLTGLPEAQVTR